jgi:zona occludens toxin (predicted ATPase)
MNDNETDAERYPLDDASIALFAELTRQIEALNHQWRGALALFLRQHQLDGVWRPAANGRELERVQQQQHQQNILG